ncbi:MAG TPA: SDR family oxidoreductase [Hanamia sp.]|nr:SDR family oxidoreductase [Hanamia sp.]
MKIFVTGHKGYIGPHLISLLKEAGHAVTACDISLFEEAKIADTIKPDKELIKDIRDLTPKDLKGHDCVMHLAAISNDPMGDLNPEITYSINREGSIHLARISKEAGVKRFLFSSSCSIYGKGVNNDLDENAGVNPLTAYAISKIAVEEALAEMADENFCTTFLRNSTAYGYSPIFRIDLVVNNLLACAIAKGEIRIMSDGEPWRPLIHCKDIARAFVSLASAHPDKINAKAINIGGNKENYQVKDVASIVKELIPSSKVFFTGEVGNDPRDYRVNFNLLNEIVPDFKLEYTLRSGMQELFEKLQLIHFSEKDFDGDRFTRLKLLKKHFDKISVTI